MLQQPESVVHHDENFRGGTCHHALGCCTKVTVDVPSFENRTHLLGTGITTFGSSKTFQSIGIFSAITPHMIIPQAMIVYFESISHCEVFPFQPVA